MGRLIGWMGISLDGRIAGPDGDLSWNAVDQEVHAAINADLGRMDAFLHGRRMWETLAKFWATVDDDPDFPATGEFARIWRRMPQYVVSRTLDEAGWGGELSHDLHETVLHLRRTYSGDFTAGGAELIRSLIELDEVDELRLLVHPAVVGAGPRLFEGEGPRRDFVLEDSRVFGTGAVMLQYARSHADARL